MIEIRDSDERHSSRCRLKDTPLKETHPVSLILGLTRLAPKGLIHPQLAPRVCSSVLPL